MAKKTMSLTPAVRHLRYELVSSAIAGTETSHFIDLAKDLSRINRRLYRSGRVYHVKKITIISSNTPNAGVPAPGINNRISVSTAPDSWVARNAWHRAKTAWDKMNDTAQGQLAGNIAGTWADFKVWLTADMAGATLVSPLDNGGAPLAAPGNWDFSQFITPDGTTTDDAFYATLLGDHVGVSPDRISVGLIRSYGESRATVQNIDPNVPSNASSDPLVNLFDYGTTIDDVVDNLEDHNDAPPYSIVQYPGGSANMTKPLVVQDTTVVDGRATMSSFSAIFGQLEFELKSPIVSDTFSVLIELASGKYRGIKSDTI